MSPRYGVSVWCRIRSSKDRTQDLCERTGSLQTSENHAEKMCFLAPFLSETRAWDVPAPWSGAIPRRSGPKQAQNPPALRGGAPAAGGASGRGSSAHARLQRVTWYFGFGGGIGSMAHVCHRGIGLPVILTERASALNPTSILADNQTR